MQHGARPKLVKPAQPIPVIEVTGDELKLLLSRLLTVAMTERVQRVRVRTDFDTGQLAFQINHDLWSPAIGHSA